jgi:hypothetical protein
MLKLVLLNLWFCYSLFLWSAQAQNALKVLGVGFVHGRVFVETTPNTL